MRRPFRIPVQLPKRAVGRFVTCTTGAPGSTVDDDAIYLQLTGANLPSKGLDHWGEYAAMYNKYRLKAVSFDVLIDDIQDRSSNPVVYSGNALSNTEITALPAVSATASGQWLCTHGKRRHTVAKNGANSSPFRIRSGRISIRKLTDPEVYADSWYDIGTDNAVLATFLIGAHNLDLSNVFATVSDQFKYAVRTSYMVEFRDPQFNL